MQISKTLIITLNKLIAGEPIAASRLRKDIADVLLSEGLLTVQARGSHRTFKAINCIALKNFLRTHYEGLRSIGNEKNSTFGSRSEQALETGNSKLVKIRSCPGFPVNSYEPIVCTLHGVKYVINPSEGTFTFISDWEQFAIPDDVIVVGIENMENFRQIRCQRMFFDTEIGNGHLLFVSRYPQSTDLRQWLLSIPNRYVHFGDFDLAGIHIFLTEFYQHLGGRSTFLIPSDIEQRLMQGSVTRYNAQYAKFHTLQCGDKQLQSLIDLINRLHRCYDQEGYINFMSSLH